MPVPPGAPRPVGYGAVVLPVRREAMRTQGFVAVPSFRVEALGQAPAPAAASPMMRKAPDVLSVTSGCAARQATVPVPIQAAATGYQALRPPTAPRRPAVPLAPRGVGPGATTVGATSPVAAPRVVRVRTSPSPRRMDIAPHADAMRLPTPARAVQIPVVQSSTAITALSPVCRTRVILPTDRSPKASPVLRGFGFPQTVVRKAPEVAKAEAKPEAVQLLQPEVAKEAAATKSVDAPKEPLSVPSDGTAKEEQKEINEAAKESKLDVQTGQGEHRDSPDLLGDFRSQTSTQASEVKCESPQIAGVPVLEEEVRSVRPLPPRPQHAPDLREVLAEAVDDPVGFAWEFLPDRHPVEAEGERRFVGECLARVGLELQVAGGLARYVQKREDLTQLHCRLEASETENVPLQVLRVVLEETLQERVRRGGQGIFVQAGVMMSMGNKKVVKIACSCDGSEGHLSVCWDWDVKLEPKCDH